MRNIEISEIDKVEAIGHFISTFYSDLKYIKNFQYYKKKQEKQIQESSLLTTNKISFYSFLKEFRIIRNIEKGKSNDLIEFTIKFINENNSNEVDKFAECLKSESGLTRDKKTVSLASKIMFLNNPLENFPMDQLVRKSLGLKSNIYKDYMNEVNNFKDIYSNVIDDCMDSSVKFIKVIENDYELKGIEKINEISRNRIIDKLLWTIGKKI